MKLLIILASFLCFTSYAETKLTVVVRKADILITVISDATWTLEYSDDLDDWVTLKRRVKRDGETFSLYQGIDFKMRQGFYRVIEDDPKKQVSKT